MMDKNLENAVPENESDKDAAAKLKSEAPSPEPDKAPKSEKTDEPAKTSDESHRTPEKPDEPAEPEKNWREYLPKLLTVSPSPHLRTEDTSRSIMLDVCIALLPALIWGIYVFGFRALTITVISVGFSVLSEFLWEKLMKKPVTILDFSAVVTGLLLALNLPVSVPLWMPAIGAVFAIIVVKQLFGGIGKNFVNPALAARVFLFAWPQHMGAEAYTAPGVKLSPFAISLPSADVVSSATPLAALKTGSAVKTSMFDMIIGYEAGCIGEVSALLLTAGFVYLLWRKVITWKIPVFYIGTVAIVTFIAARTSLPFEFAGQEIFSGGLFLGAIFMATDYTTSPITEKGRVIYAVGCGLLTVFIRYFGGYSEGVSFSILIMNLLVWYLDRYTKPVRFGGAVNDGSEKSGKKA